jgi:hypothetical protein
MRLMYVDFVRTQYTIRKHGPTGCCSPRVSIFFEGGELIGMHRCAYDRPVDKARTQMQQSFVNIGRWLNDYLDEPNLCVFPRRLSQSTIEALW